MARGSKRERRSLHAVIALAGTILALIAVNPPDAPASAFPGTNGLIVFENAGDLWTISPDGTGLTKIPNTTGGTTPAWSPNGEKIAFTQGNNIFVVDADGTDLLQLTTGFNDRGPSWSPDGTRIVFESSQTLNREIWVMNSGAPGLQTQLTNDPGADSHPSWSPDGTRIAWESNRSGDSQVWAMNADGTGQVQVSTIGSLEENSRPSWSPDGAKLAFDIDDGQNVDVFTVNSTGPPLDQKITDNATSAFSNVEPAFSPDGTQIAFNSDQAAVGIDQIWLMNANGTGQTQVTTTGGNYPDWQPTPLASPPPPADPPPADPVPDTTPPSITIAVADGKLKLNKKGKPGELNLNPRGKGILVLTCSADEQSPPCTGEVKLTTAEKIATRKGAKRKFTLAKFDFSLGAGEKKRFRVQLKKALLRLVEDEPAAREAEIRASVADAVGNTAKVRANVKLTPA